MHRRLRSLFLIFTGTATLLAAAPAPDAGTPLTLDEAIKLALENNQDIRVSAYYPQIASANLLAEYGTFDPALTFTRTSGETETPGAYAAGSRPLGKTDDYSLALTGLAPWGLSYSIGATAENNRSSLTNFTNSYTTFSGITVTQPLLRNFGFSANLYGLRVAKATHRISEWQYRQTLIDTITNVVYVFNNLQQAHDNLRIARLYRDLAARLLDENEKRRTVGSIDDAAVTQARARMADREEAVLISERSVRDIEHRLRRLMGQADPNPDSPPLPFVELAAPPEIAVHPAQDYKTALELRPDYQAARLGLKIDRASTSYYRNQLLPKVNLVGSYGYGGLDPTFSTARAQVRDRDARAYSAGIVVSVPLTFAEGRGRYRAAKLARLQAEANLVRLEQDIAINISAAAGQIETTRLRVAATQKAMELAQQSLEDEQKRLKAGSIGSSTYMVLQQQGYVATAQRSHAAALADQRRALATYEATIGTTLDRHHIVLSESQP